MSWCVLLLAVAGSAAHADQLPVLKTAEYQFFLQRPVAKEDVLILQRADEILSDETKWDRTDNRRCNRNAASLSLLCALRRASIEVAGSYRHRRVAMDEVRFAAKELSIFSAKRPVHAITDFNNLPSTQFKDVKQALKLSIDRLSARLPRGGS